MSFSVSQRVSGIVAVVAIAWFVAATLEKGRGEKNGQTGESSVPTQIPQAGGTSPIAPVTIPQASFGPQSPNIIGNNNQINIGVSSVDPAPIGREVERHAPGLDVSFDPLKDIEALGEQRRGYLRVRNTRSDRSLRSVTLRVARLEIVGLVDNSALVPTRSAVDQCINAPIRLRNDKYALNGPPLLQEVSLLSPGDEVAFWVLNVGPQTASVQLARHNVQYLRGAPNYLSDDCGLPQGVFRLFVKAEALDERVREFGLEFDNSAAEIRIVRVP